MSLPFYLAILSPLVLTADLLLLLGSEVVGDVEGLADLLGRLALDHVGNGLASNIKKGLDVKIVRSLVGHAISIGETRNDCGRYPVKHVHTRIISKSISWSTCINF